MSVVNGTWLDAIMELSTAEPSEKYHGSNGVSNSMLSVYLDDPREYYYQFKSGRYVQPQKDHFDFGQATHDITLLGEDRVVVIPEDVLTKDGKRAGNAWKEFKAANEGRMLLKPADYAAVMRCVNAVREHSIAGPFLKACGASERSFWATIDGLVLRCRPDRIIRWRGKTIVLDLKTSVSTVAPKFVRAIANYGYANQEYFYRKVLKALGIDVDAFVFVVVKDSEPHCVDCYTINDDWKELAKREVEEGLASLANRLESNDWSAVTNSQIVELSPPNFLNYKGEYSL